MSTSTETIRAQNAIKKNEIDFNLEGPSWNNSTEYPSLHSNEFIHDKTLAIHLIEDVRQIIETIRPLMEKALPGGAGPLSLSELHQLTQDLQNLSEVHEHVNLLIQNLATYVHCELSINGKNPEAKKAQSEISKLYSNLKSAYTPVLLFLIRAPDDLVQIYLSHPQTAPEAFSIQRARLLNETRLSEKEETLLAEFQVPGFQAWNDLYDQISSSLTCRIQNPDGSVQEMGLAQASGLTRDTSEPIRRNAWLAIQDAWKHHENSGAAILNNLASWRLETYRRRSQTRKVHYLDFALHDSCIRRETLDAMMSVLRDEIDVPRRAMELIARGIGKTQLDPWDLLAPAPSESHESRRPFKTGIQLIHDAFTQVDSKMGDFVLTMAKNRWIEGRVLPTKQQGAYCTRFAKSRTPRVYQTYMGSISDIRTLAHELGHAYHNWVMRDLPRVLTRYPMTLAETASIFGETAFADFMGTNPDPHVRNEIAWQNAESAANLLLNIPARFDFEMKFHEARQKSFVPPEELGDLMEEAWMKWYGDTISMADRQFWMTKLHFSLAGTSFYNFPYTFGYLFSLGLYAIRKERGPEFNSAYIDLLRDTGQMTAEELAQRHLGVDLALPDFWRKSMEIVKMQVSRFAEQLQDREALRN